MKKALAGLALLLASAPAMATTVIGPTSVSSPQGEFPGLPLINIINQSGLSAPYTTGVTPFAAYVGATTHPDLADTGFTNTESNGPQQFTFDLGIIKTIDAIAIWNSGSVGSVSSFELFADNDNDFGNGTLGLILPATALSSTINPAQVFTFAPTSTRFVHFNGLASLTPPDFYGLGEVVFRSGIAVPEPSTALAGIIGLAGLVLRRRRVA